VNGEVKFKVLNADMLVLLDIIRKHSQIEIDTLEDSKLLEKTDIDDELISLGHSCCYVQMELTDNLDDLFKAVSSISATLTSNIKETYLIYKENKGQFYFSYRLLKILENTESIGGLEDLKTKTEDIKKNEVNNNLITLLRGSASMFKIDDNMVMLSGKLHRETWDLLTDLGYPYTTFRTFGSFEKDDKFSGFVCMFENQIERLKVLTNSNIPGVSEDLSPILQLKKKTMRHLKFIYLEHIKHSDLQKEHNRWIEANFELVPFHYLLDFTSDRPDEDKDSEFPYVQKGRPLDLNNGLIRDSFISNKGIGFLVVTEDGELNRDIYNKIGAFVKYVVTDLGIKDFQLVTDFYEDERKLDILRVNSAIELAEVNFLKVIK
jgi:hypothetical protein